MSPAAQQPENGPSPFLTETMYDELRRLARSQLGRGQVGRTLPATALVHEAWVRLAQSAKGGAKEWSEDRQHFYAVAARAMRNVLVDRARAIYALKRTPLQPDPGSDQTHESVPAADVLAIHESLGVLENLDPQLSAIVELRYFGGLTVEETSEALSISMRTVDRGWATARAWLRARL